MLSAGIEACQQWTCAVSSNTSASIGSAIAALARVGAGASKGRCMQRGRGYLSASLLPT